MVATDDTAGMDAPSEGEIAALAAELHLDIPDEDLGAFAALVDDRLAPLRRLDGMTTGSDELPSRSWSRPAEDEDPHNAWITRCELSGSSKGLLAGKTVGLKDTISVGGMPCSNGSEIFAEYVPRRDATIVRRLLDHGATIRGKHNMWSFSMGASDFGPVSHPTSTEYGIGGSSSGTAAAVAAEEVDIGIGGDQGGSIRMPSAFAGLVGLKPTHGLVPYTGIFGADPTIDHTGPLTRTLEDAAMTLSAIAGRDEQDPRQPCDLSVGSYGEAVGADAAGMRVGVLREGFDHPDTDPAVEERVREAIRSMEREGVEISEVSVPEHELAADITLVIVRYGYGELLNQAGVVVGSGEQPEVEAIDRLASVFRTDAAALPVSAKSSMLLAAYVQEERGGTAYARAQTLATEVREAYDEMLDEVDALAMPTVPIAPPSAGGSRGLETLTEGGDSPIARNTAPFNASHHPALSVPTGQDDGAPVGTTLVGGRFEESTLFTLGSALEGLRT